MSHLVESMAYVNSTPWHGLGNRLAPKQSLETWAIEAGISFEIKETPVRYMTENEGIEISVDFPEQKVLFRSDTDAPLSVVSQRYQVVQPREILEFYRDLTEVSGFELETAGSLKGGRKIWALAKTNQSANLKGGDQINGYLLLATACDGTLATTAQFTSVRVVCNNTLALALSGGQGAVKVPHSTCFDPEAVKKQLRVSVSHWDSFIYQMKTLSERRIKTREAEAYFRSVLGVAGGSETPTTNGRAMKKAMQLYDGQGKGTELTSARGTAFGLLNSIRAAWRTRLSAFAICRHL